MTVPAMRWPGPPDESKVLLRAHLPLPPLPKERHRTGNGQVYTPQRTRAFEEACGWLLRAVWRKPETTATLGVWVVFHVSAADVDNLVKAFLDGGNGIVWADDGQVEHVIADVNRKGGTPGIDVLVWDATVAQPERQPAPRGKRGGAGSRAAGTPPAAR